MEITENGVKSMREKLTRLESLITLMQVNLSSDEFSLHINHTDSIMGLSRELIHDCLDFLPRGANEI